MTANWLPGKSPCSRERLGWKREHPATGPHSLGSAWPQRGFGPLQRCLEEYSEYASKARGPLKTRRPERSGVSCRATLSISNNKVLFGKDMLAKTTRVSMPLGAFVQSTLSAVGEAVRPPARLSVAAGDFQ